MVILYTGELSEQQKEKFETDYPNQEFIFCEDMFKVVDRLAEVDVLVGYGRTIKHELIDQLTNLKWIMMLSAGVDKLPLTYIAEKGIIVTNARGVYKVPMAEYVISMLLQVYLQEKTLIKNENDKKWVKDFPIREISGQTMLVVGAGAIGQEVARLAKAFQMKTYGVSRSGSALEHFDENYPIEALNKLLPKADFVVSVLPGTEETEGVFKFEQFQLMKNDAVFVNVGRGNSVSSEDLLKAIQQKEIAHAILDVFEKEPLPSDHPFWTEENITVTPHLSAKSPKNAERILNVFRENLNKYIEGNTDFVNIVDVIRGY